MDHTDRLDGVLTVLDQARLHRARVHTVPPVPRDQVHHEPQLHGNLLPENREVPGFHHQHPVTGREGVDQRRLPCAGAGGGVDDHRSLGPKDVADTVQQLAAECLKLRPAMIDGGPGHGAQHPVGHVGRSWDLQEVTAWTIGHDSAGIILGR